MAKLFTQLQSNTKSVLYSPGKCSLERHNFRMITQLPTESVDQFVTRLREKADCCEFGETADENIRD